MTQLSFKNQLSGAVRPYTAKEHGIPLRKAIAEGLVCIAVIKKQLYMYILDL